MLVCNNCLDSQSKHSNNPVTQCSQACTKLTPNDNRSQAKKKGGGEKEKKLTSPERCCPVDPKHAITHPTRHSHLSTVKKPSHHPNIKKKKRKKEQQTEGRLPVLFFTVCRLFL